VKGINPTRSREAMKRIIVTIESAMSKIKDFSPGAFCLGYEEAEIDFLQSKLTSMFKNVTFEIRSTVGGWEESECRVVATHAELDGIAAAVESLLKETKVFHSEAFKN
jgi:hypothetical protein